MYTLYIRTGEVVRDSDNKIVAPCIDEFDTDYLAYINWINQGNEPTIGSLSPTEKASIQDKMWGLIRDERDRRKSNGGYKVGNYWYHSDDTSRIQQIGLVMLGANMPNNILWKTMSGDFVPMTPTLAGQIFQSAMVSDMTIFAVAEQKKQAMLASNDPASYDYLSGWPKCYGE